MKLGLFGGSFNPVHLGHLIAAAFAAEAEQLDRVLFIPTAVSPLKNGRDLAPARDRWAMLRAALRGNPRFEACNLELRRGGISYTIDTLRELRRKTDARLYWILGADAARLLPRWKSIDQVRALARFVVLARPGDRLPPRTPKQTIVDMPPIGISSTDIRARIRAGRTVRYLVPDAVERYLRRKGLYR